MGGLAKEEIPGGWVKGYITETSYNIGKSLAPENPIGPAHSKRYMEEWKKEEEEMVKRGKLKLDDMVADIEMDVRKAPQKRKMENSSRFDGLERTS